MLAIEAIRVNALGNKETVAVLMLDVVAFWAKFWPVAFSQIK